MNASQRARRVAAETKRAKVVREANSLFGASFPALRVKVKGTDVYQGVVFRGRRLGSLHGASAGVLDIRPPTGGQLLNSLVTGYVGRIGTAFVAFADGTRFESPIKMGSQAQLRAVDEQIAKFNLLVDALG